MVQTCEYLSSQSQVATCVYIEAFKSKRSDFVHGGIEPTWEG